MYVPKENARMATDPVNRMKGSLLVPCALRE
jgi:hypothetical protein